MKKFFLKKAPLWLLTVAIGSTAVVAGFIGNVGASDEDRPWATTEYFLVRDVALDTVNDSLTVLGKPDNDTLTITTGFINFGGGVYGPKCSSKCSNSTCDNSGVTNDSIFPATGAAYYGSFVIALSGNNSLEGRIPQNIFHKSTGYMNPGKKATSITLLTDAYNTAGNCYYIEGTETWTFKKYRVSLD